jgi:hypothetical protein
MERFFKGDTIQIICDTDWDNLDDATLIEFIVCKPSGEITYWIATQVGETQDITYTTEPTDLDELGTYKTQSHVEWGANSELHGEIEKFKVIASLED